MLLSLSSTPSLSLLSKPKLNTIIHYSFSPPPHLKSLLLSYDRKRRRRRRRGRLAPRADLIGALDSARPVVEAVAVLAAIIVVHESGHFAAAALRGIHVSKFAVGFGPVLARFVAGGVEYSLRAFPLGGFVGFPDDDPDSGIPADDPDLLRNRPVPDRLLVVSAGVAANLAFAYALVLAQALSVGLPVHSPLPGVLVPEVRPGSAAARDGLLPGDLVLEAAGSPAPSVADLVDLIKSSPGRRVPFLVSRIPPAPQSNPYRLEISVIPDADPDGTGRIGVQLSPNFKLFKLRPRDLPEAVQFANREFAALAFTVFDGLRQTFLNFSQSVEKVSGPVAIIAVGAEVARSSTDGLFQFAAVINLNLAAINLLPLPALDGGSLALILMEAARGGRKLPKEWEQRIMSSGILLVLMLGLVLIVRDTLNLEFIKEML